jgi:hypothetical protein
MDGQKYFEVTIPGRGKKQIVIAIWPGIIFEEVESSILTDEEALEVCKQIIGKLTGQEIFEEPLNQLKGLEHVQTGRRTQTWP